MNLRHSLPRKPHKFSYGSCESPHPCEQFGKTIFCWQSNIQYSNNAFKIRSLHWRMRTSRSYALRCICYSVLLGLTYLYVLHVVDSKNMQNSIPLLILPSNICVQRYESFKIPQSKKNVIVKLQIWTCGIRCPGSLASFHMAHAKAHILANSLVKNFLLAVQY